VVVWPAFVPTLRVSFVCVFHDVYPWSVACWIKLQAYEWVSKFIWYGCESAAGCDVCEFIFILWLSAIFLCSLHDLN
jgi:hypothetical protein